VKDAAKVRPDEQVVVFAPEDARRASGPGAAPRVTPHPGRDRPVAVSW
jgi:hypothetical protein